MYYEDSKEAYLIDDNEDPRYATWDGVRLSIGASLVLGELAVRWSGRIS